jgi:Mrp family chromosome partitioning ATPase
MLACHPVALVSDDGHAISYKVLRRGTPVRSADGEQVGTVRRVLEATRENIFDGIVIDTPAGKRFVDAPEVARIAERAVTLTFPASDAEEHLTDVSSRLASRLGGSTTARRAKRLSRRARDAWDRR